ncbi:Zn-dependent hydrolase [Maritimibacter sp. 55A14]|uniref:MBL fold metallo-hydrolase n=1 Tax=Maritimibacter sp. 55A14 TaxID=2174844 RepID=UPI000D60589A|nr:MBL fold metallo-hydrolase [Maritimibacter sp. 55A14]PWE33321.1 Zn-dependent hydrolase [Maritimibacter sp. 55A14]
MIRLALAACLAFLLPAGVAAQTRQSHCVALADAAPGIVYLHHSAFGAPLGRDRVRLNYVGHATFVLETPEGIVAATDYTGTLGYGDIVPDVVTMNIAHSSHWTSSPDPRIPNVLQGWDVAGEPTLHHLELGDLLVRNVPTDIRGGFEGRRNNGNSIFVFEVAGLCIGHLGHLHHEPSPEQYAALGRLDVVMAPVDGGFTMAQEAMIRVLGELRASVVLPMHWFGESNLRRFLAGMEAKFEIVESGESALEISLRELPERPVVQVLRPHFLAGPLE